MEKLNPSRSNQFAFIPHKLIIEGRPELEVFSYNILFMSHANIDGVDTAGTALYSPDLGSYSQDGQKQSLRYFNQYQKSIDFAVSLQPPADYEAEDYVDVTYYPDEEKYEAAKYISGQLAYESFGKNWKGFFIHLTMMGLQPGEACEFCPIRSTT